MVSRPSLVNIQDSGCEMTLRASKDAEGKEREAQELFSSSIYQAQMTAEGIILPSSVVSAVSATGRGQGSPACLPFCHAVRTSVTSAKKSRPA